MNYLKIFHRLSLLPLDYLFTDVTGQNKGVKAAYYNNPNLWGEPKHVLIEREIIISGGIKHLLQICR